MDGLIAAFERCNGSEYFEFIERITESSHGRKCKLKCKTCGSVFDTWQVNEVQKGAKTRITCPDCGMSSDGDVVFAKSPKLGELLKYYTEGHTARETAEKFGLSKMQVDNYVKNHKVSNGRSFRDGTSEHNKKQAKEAEARLEAILESKGFVYCGGYTDRNGKVEIACKTCGLEFINCVDTVQHGVVICPACEREKVLARQAERKAESAKRQKELEAEWAEQRRQTQIRKQRERDAKLDKVYVCKVCGKEYTPRQYMQDEGLTLFSNVGYCSHACKRKAMNRLSKNNKKAKGIRDNDRRRAKKYGVEYDSSITLKKLVARDGLRCAICGGMCDWSDTKWGYSGPTYPSKDHIIPMAKGGPHIWENMQVAHVMCNSEKGDRVSV
jgi:hypothetical protein